MLSMPPTMVMTALMDEPAFALFDGLRRQHFPPARNIVPAHISLFHTLPEAALEPITATALRALADHSDRRAAVTGTRFLGRGVAFDVAAPGLVGVRATIAQSCSEWLTPQDRQRFNPHVTIQNKADPAIARALAKGLDGTRPMFMLTGLRLWRYLDDGRWAGLRTLAWP